MRGNPNAVFAHRVDSAGGIILELGLTTFAEINDSGISPESGCVRWSLRPGWPTSSAWTSTGSVSTTGRTWRPRHRRSCWPRSPARRSSIRLSSAVTVLSSADPVRVLQAFVTLDLVSDGRAELMVGRGSFTESFPLFGYSLSDYDELLAEKLDRCWRCAPTRKSPGRAGSGRRWSRRWCIRGRSGRCPSGSPLAARRPGRPGRHPGAAARVWRSSVAEPHRSCRWSTCTAEPWSTAGTTRRPRWRCTATDTSSQTRPLPGAEFLPAYRATFAKIGREARLAAHVDAAVEALIAPEGALFFGTPETVAEKIIGCASR